MDQKTIVDGVVSKSEAERYYEMDMPEALGTAESLLWHITQSFEDGNRKLMAKSIIRAVVFLAARDRMYKDLQAEEGDAADGPF